MADTEVFKAEGKKTRLTITPDRITVKVSNRHSKYPIETFLKLANKLNTFGASKSWRGVVKISGDDMSFILHDSRKINFINCNYNLLSDVLDISEDSQEFISI